VAVVQIIWVPVVVAAILVVVVLEVALLPMQREEVEVPIMGDQIKPTLQDPLQNGMITVR